MKSTIILHCIVKVTPDMHFSTFGKRAFFTPELAFGELLGFHS
jgi:hypothetical protein